MTQALNYTPKAIATLSAYEKVVPPLARMGLRYLINKLEQAEVFMLPDYGQLMDRGRPRPEVPGIILRPPFSVVALEYSAPPRNRNNYHPVFEADTCPRRIALAWDWKDDLPLEMNCFGRWDRGPGVAVASISFYDQLGDWAAVNVAAHIPYDTVWECPVDNPTRNILLELGRLTKAQANAKTPRADLIPLQPEMIMNAVRTRGADTVYQGFHMDLMDEVSAYLDVCYALACKNVSTERTLAPAKLNQSRLKAGKPALRDFHVLKLAGEDALALTATNGDRQGPRPHLRRGHIRRLTADRLTWVNQAMVRGRGQFVEKVYSL